MNIAPPLTLFRPHATALAAGIALLLTACGGSDTSTTQASGVTTATTATAQADDDAGRPDTLACGDACQGDGTLSSTALAAAATERPAAVASSPDAVWTPLTVMAVTDPMSYGAAGNGASNDAAALSAAVNALPRAGGIVYLPPGTRFRKDDVLTITKSHVKFWAPNRQSTIEQRIVDGRHAIVCRGNVGCGFFGLRLTSNADFRGDNGLEQGQIVSDHGTLLEVTGNEIVGSPGTAVFMFGSVNHYLQGNSFRNTYADLVHHTEGAHGSWVWGNTLSNTAPSNGDDGIACVTYGVSSTRCGDMEWWRNTILGTGWGRGYSVIGGNNIHIHDNWAIGVAGAGIIVASEPATSFGTSSSKNIRIERNFITRSGHTIGHPSILVSGDNPQAEPLQTITLVDNVATPSLLTGEPYRAEGRYSNVLVRNLRSSQSDLPPEPTAADARVADTSVLRTQDVSHVPSTYWPGLLRIHVRRAGSQFQQRFEYAVKGPDAAVSAFLAQRRSQGDYVCGSNATGTTRHALLYARTPLTLPSGLSSVPFRQIRQGDLNGNLRWMWNKVDAGTC